MNSSCKTAYIEIPPIGDVYQSDSKLADSGLLVKFYLFAGKLFLLVSRLLCYKICHWIHRFVVLLSLILKSQLQIWDKDIQFHRLVWQRIKQFGVFMLFIDFWDIKVFSMTHTLVWKQLMQRQDKFPLWRPYSSTEPFFIPLMFRIRRLQHLNQLSWWFDPLL